jgi:DNA-binding MarR family transcriptional regulator
MELRPGIVDGAAARDQSRLLASRPLEIPSTTASGVRELRERNRLRIVEALKNGDLLSQASISRKTGLSRTTVSAIVVELTRQGFLETKMVTPSEATGGRRGTALKLTPAGSSVFSTGSDQVDRVNCLIEQNAALASDNARLKSILRSIEELATNSRTQHGAVLNRGL